MTLCPVCGVDAAREDLCPACGTVLDGVPASVPPPGNRNVSATPSPEIQPVAQAHAADAAAYPPAPGTVAAAACLILKRSGALTSESFPIAGRVVVGRFDRDTGPVDVDLDHLAESSSITRLHAELWCDASGCWYVKDLGSRNGTFVRRAAESKFQRADGEQLIADGDELALGNVRFMFKIG